MINLRNLLFITVILLTVSCSNDYDASDYPKTLSLTETNDTVKVFKNGAQVEASEEELNFFYESKKDFFEDLDNTLNDNSFFEFLNEDELTYNLFSNTTEEATANYRFTDNVLNIAYEEGIYYPIAEGSIEELKQNLIMVYSKKENSSGSSILYGIDETSLLLPLTFDNT